MNSNPYTISADIFSSWVDASVSAPPCTFAAKLAAACDDLLVYQHIDKSTGFRGEQYSLLDIVITKDPTDVSAIPYLDQIT